MLLKTIAKEGLNQRSSLVDGGDDSRMIFRARSQDVEGQARQPPRPEKSKHDYERNQVRRASLVGWLLGPAIVLLTLLSARGCAAPGAGGDAAELKRLSATVNHQQAHQERTPAPVKLGISTPQRQGG